MRAFTSVALAILAATPSLTQQAAVRLQPRGTFETPDFAELDFGERAPVPAHGRAGDQLVFHAPDTASAAAAASPGSGRRCPPSGTRVRKVAVIGAGASGSSAAWWLSKAHDKLGQDEHWSGKAPLSGCREEIEITVFEREERIGGRTAVVYPFDDPEHYDAIELGASIFADVNRNMVRAAKYFNLTTGAKLGEEGSVTSIWDGQQFVFEDLDNGWWNSAKMLWRYGASPMKTQSLVKDLVNRFLKIYSKMWMHGGSLAGKPSGYPWARIEDFAAALGFDELAARTTLDYFYHTARIAKLFVVEIVEAATRVNYGQNSDQLHTLGGGVSLAASGATGVVGGNYKIFESMVGDSGARLRLGRHGEVTGIIKFDNVEEYRASGKAATDGDVHSEDWSSGVTKWHVGTVTSFGALYDAVFIGTPWHQTSISLLNSDGYIPHTEYVHLHVTLVVTTAARPRGEYFGRGADDVMPTTVLTTYNAIRKDIKRGGDEDEDDQEATRHPRLDFNSLNYLSKLGPRKSANDGGAAEGAEQHLVKIFSEGALSDKKLEEIFGAGKVDWVHRKEWDAYPYLKPTRDFPPIQVDERLYYLNAMEPLVSTMETSTVSSRNAVALLLKEWYGADFVHGGKGCAAHLRASEQEDEGGYSKGWEQWGCEGA